MTFARKTLLVVVSLIVVYLIVVNLPKSTPKVIKTTPSPTPDAYELFKKNSKPVKVTNKNNYSNRSFVVYVPDNFVVEGDKVIHGSKDDADFYFYHDLDYLVDLLMKKVTMKDAKTGELGEFGEYERSQYLEDGYVHQIFHFPRMNGMEYLFRCDYKETYKSGDYVCASMVKNLAPLTTTKEYYDSKFINDMSTISPTK